MFHHVAHAARGRLLFIRDTEALALWNALSAAFPELIALTLMPDHYHLVLPHDDPGNRLHPVLQGHAQLRNRRAHRTGALWTEREPPVAVPDALHLRRTIRYIHLNPCRANLVRDPLAWPFSTHRDRCGLAARPVVSPERDPSGFHRFVSADDSCDPAGTPFPTRTFAAVAVPDVTVATSSVWRAPMDTLARRGEPRTTGVKVAWHLGVRDRDALCGAFNLSRPQLYVLVRHVPGRGALLRDPLEGCARTVGDPRFNELSDRDERRFPAWTRYRGRD